MIYLLVFRNNKRFISFKKKFVVLCLLELEKNEHEKFNWTYSTLNTERCFSMTNKNSDASYITVFSITIFCVKNFIFYR